MPKPDRNKFIKRQKELDRLQKAKEKLEKRRSAKKEKSESENSSTGPIENE